MRAYSGIFGAEADREKVGIWPVGILFSVFAGMKLFGIVGIIKGPVSLVIICETCKYLFAEKEENVKEDG